MIFHSTIDTSDASCVNNAKLCRMIQRYDKWRHESNDDIA